MFTIQKLENYNEIYHGFYHINIIITDNSGKIVTRTLANIEKVSNNKEYHSYLLTTLL